MKTGLAVPDKLLKTLEEDYLKRAEKREFEGYPVKAIERLLTDVHVNCVKLQHLAGKIWVRKVLGDVSG